MLRASVLSIVSSIIIQNISSVKSQVSSPIPRETRKFTPTFYENKCLDPQYADILPNCSGPNQMCIHTGEFELADDFINFWPSFACDCQIGYGNITYEQVKNSNSDLQLDCSVNLMELDLCSDIDCGINGECLQGVKDDNSYYGAYCKCLRDFEDDFCETPKAGSVCENVNCGENGTCQKGKGSTHKCTCQEDYYGETCETFDRCRRLGSEVCEPCGKISKRENKLCPENATCIDPDNNYCQCKPGFGYGDFHYEGYEGFDSESCDIDLTERDLCSSFSDPMSPKPIHCGYHGKCVQGISDTKFEEGRGFGYYGVSCQCDSGWSGASCNIPDINNPCYNVDCNYNNWEPYSQGQCVEGQCICKEHYYGESCQDYDRCRKLEKEIFGPSGCGQNSKCVDSGNNKLCDDSTNGCPELFCECEEGWSGDDCEVCNLGNDCPAENKNKDNISGLHKLQTSGKLYDCWGEDILENLFGKAPFLVFDTNNPISTYVSFQQIRQEDYTFAISLGCEMGNNDDSFKFLFNKKEKKGKTSLEFINDIYYVCITDPEDKKGVRKVWYTNDEKASKDKNSKSLKIRFKNVSCPSDIDDKETSKPFDYNFLPMPENCLESQNVLGSFRKICKTCDGENGFRRNGNGVCVFDGQSQNHGQNEPTTCPAKIKDKIPRNGYFKKIFKGKEKSACNVNKFLEYLFSKNKNLEIDNDLEINQHKDDQGKYITLSCKDENSLLFSNYKDELVNEQTTEFMCSSYPGEKGKKSWAWYG